MTILAKSTSTVLSGGSKGKLLEITKVGNLTSGGLGYTVHPSIQQIGTAKKVYPEKLPFRITLASSNTYRLTAGADDLTYSLS